jgi:hypothetical protein
MFGAPKPLSRSRSVTERRPSASGRSSSRRQSVVEDHGIPSPPPEMSEKAARMLGVTPNKLSRSKSERKTRSRGMLRSHSPQLREEKTDPFEGVDEDDDIVMVDKDEDAPSPEKSSRDRKGKSKVFDAPPPAVPCRPQVSIHQLDDGP